MQGLTLATPELVPFRLTQNMVDGFGVTGIEGVFRRSAEAALAVLRDNRAALVRTRRAWCHLHPCRKVNLRTTLACTAPAPCAHAACSLRWSSHCTGHLARDATLLSCTVQLGAFLAPGLQPHRHLSVSMAWSHAMRSAPRPYTLPTSSAAPGLHPHQAMPGLNPRPQTLDPSPVRR